MVCYDVLQYLGDAAAARALANFGRLCCGVLYFSALTRYDLKHNADPERTDAAVHLRSAHWYRSRLRRDFRDVGLGFWLRRGGRSCYGSWSEARGARDPGNYQPTGP